MRWKLWAEDGRAVRQQEPRFDNLGTAALGLWGSRDRREKEALPLLEGLSYSQQNPILILTELKKFKIQK